MKVTNEIINNPFSNLSNIYRFSNTHLEHRESTAEHTMSMQLLALYLYNKFPGIKIDDINKRILFHDLDEMVLCDIPRDIKYYNEESHNIINEVANKKMTELHLRSEIIDWINNAKHDGTLEGGLTQVLDVLQCTYKLYTEWLLQHNTLMKVRLVESLDNLWNVLEEYSELIKGSNASDSMEHERIHDLLLTSLLELETETKYNKHTFDPKLVQYLV